MLWAVITWDGDGGLAVLRPFFYFCFVWLVCDDGGMAEVWALISAKQCVLVSDCVVFVREMGGVAGRLSGAGCL